MIQILLYPTKSTNHLFEVGHEYYQWPFQEPIDWRYLPYIRPIRISQQNMAQNMVQYVPPF